MLGLIKGKYVCYMLEFDKTNDCFNIYSYCKLVINFIGYNITQDMVSLNILYNPS